MQDIVFYAAANETLGVVRDYANERNSPAPVLTLGVSVCLRMRLFSSTDGATPYPIASLNGISDWQWSMDSDFDRGTACKLVADEGGISVHTETDTVNGETMNFTEFVIQISNMNTEELAAWLGNEKMRSGMTGELVGYDSSGNAAFVLQIENFSVRNRVAGLVDPTVLDQEIVTRTQAERMIQTAVSSSADTKQDKLTSSNAGTGISVSNAGVISVSGVPQSAVTGLVSDLTGKQDKLVVGGSYAINVTSASTAGTAGKVTLEHVYVGNSAIADGNNIIMSDFLPTANGTTPGLVKSADTNMLTISSGGISIAVQTNIAGALTSAAKAKVPTTSAVQTFVSNYVSSNSLNSGYVSSYVNSANVIPQSAVSGLSGALQSKQNTLSFDWGLEFDDDTLSLARYRTIQNPTGNSITLVPGEAYRINATTSSKTLNVGTVPDGKWGLEGHLEIFVANTGYVITGSNVVLAHPLEADAVNNCTVRFHDGMAIISVEDHIAGYIVTVSGGTTEGSLFYALGTASNPYIAVNDTLAGQILDLGGVVTSAGEKHVVGNGYADTVISGGISCTSKTTFANLSMNGVSILGGTATFGDVFVSSGATVSATGGDIVVENMKGNGVIDLSNSRRLHIPSGGTAYVSGVTLTKGYAKPTGGNWDRFGQLMFVDSTQKLVASGVSFVSNGSTGASAGGKTIYAYNGGVFELTNCTFLDNKYGAIDSVNGNVLIQDCVFGPTQSIYAAGGTPRAFIGGSNQFLATFKGTNGGSAFVIISSGAVLDMTGNTNTAVFDSVGKIIVSGSCTVINSAGASVTITGGTYTQIKNDGTTA